MAAATAEHHHAEAKVPVIPVETAALTKLAWPCAIGGLAVWGIAGAIQGSGRDLFLTYLIGFIFWLSIPLGSLALIGLAFVTSASWGIVFRRVFLASIRTIPFMALLFLPMVVSLFTAASPYWWTYDAEGLKDITQVKVALEEMEHRMHLWMNVPRFLIAAVACFSIWYLLGRFINKYAPAAEDHGEVAAYRKLRAIGGPAVILWALTWTIACTDWVMSVEVAWASTMFPVITAMNQFLTTFCFAGLLMYTLLGKNATAMSILKDKFRIDIGSLTFGFSMIWAYATYSQYMLIWAGNLPEEITYYKKRMNGGWEYLALFLVAFHWAVPFFLMLFRETKTIPSRMKKVQLMLLIVCAADVIWWVLPTYPHDGAGQYYHVPMAIAAIVGLGGVWCIKFASELNKAPFFPSKDTEFLVNWGHH
ncbi:MAG: hypothetical protein ACRCZF_23120 [Gemmataceae bacterium]